MKTQWKVGELAKLTGLTVRTLRYYDQIGLFSPSDYSDSGHRLYNETDIVRLQQIQSLKELGLTLEDIASVLAGDNFSPFEVLSLQINRLKEDIRIQQNLLKELDHVSNLMRWKEPVTVDDFTKLLGVMKMHHEKYFTKEQLEKMKKQYESIDPETMRKEEEKFTKLLTEIRHHMENGTPPTDSEVQDLAKKWSEFGNQAAEGDPEIIKAAEKFYSENPDSALNYGVDKQIYRYIWEALQDN